MKNSILNMVLLVTIFTSFTMNANSCDTNACAPKRSHNKKSYKNCNKPVDHTNRKMNTCNKGNSCAKKDVRMNKFAKRTCCPI